MGEYKSLKNAFALRHRVTLYVPGTRDVDKAADNSVYVDRVCATLSELFGGATSTPALGYWVSTERGLIKERTTMAFAYAETLNDDNISAIVDLSEWLKKELGQETIAVEIDGVMYFI